VTRRAACSPAGMHGLNEASERRGREPFAPRHRFCPVTDHCAGARPPSVSVEVCLSIRPFTRRRRWRFLRTTSAAGSKLLACIFKAVLRLARTRSASHSRPRLAFSASRGSITACDPLSDSRIRTRRLFPGFHSPLGPLDPSGSKRSTRFRPTKLALQATRSSFAPRSHEMG